MRLKFTLEIVKNKFLPADYQYLFMAVIYKLLKFGSKEFAEFLHNNGYKYGSKKFKLFCFAIVFEGKPIFRDNKLIMPSNKLNLFVSSPNISNFINNLLSGSLSNELIIITDKNIYNELRINSIEKLEEPTYENKMKFKLLSPLVLSTKIEHEGKLKPYYLRYYDDEAKINSLLKENLRKKYYLLNNNDEYDFDFKFEWDKDYISKTISKGKKITRIQTINTNNNKISIVGNLAPFTITCPPDIIKLGFECGFGEKNSLGFGYAVPA